MAADNRPLAEIFDPRFTKEMGLAERMHLVMTRADYVQKDKKDAMKYTIVSHDKVTAIIREHTVACGIFYYPVAESFDWSVDGNRVNLKLAVRFVNIHNREDTFDVGGMGFGIDTGDKGPGKAISYAVKYALLKAFGLETGDDPDFDQDVQHRSSAQQRADDLLKAAQTSPDAATLLMLLQQPSSAEIINALMSRDRAGAQTLLLALKKEAKRVDMDWALVKGSGA